ncbi:MAG TPA: hypothetical protein VN081_04580 [Dongiaceae bacterium]|nr:hypothetical protein [Dongiaceae bacterium]
MIPDDIGEALLFENGILAMEAAMSGKFVSDFFPPHNHARQVTSQFRLVLNRSRLASLWLNEQTDTLDDEDACTFVQENLERFLKRTVVEAHQTAFGNTEEVHSTMKVVAVTCYPARVGDVSSNVNDRANQVATRRFVVHYNGF